MAMTNSEVPRHIIILCLCLLLFFPAPSSSVNLKKFLSGNRNDDDTKELISNLAKQADPTVDEDHHHHDASTGTVIHNTKTKKEPATCNEMMAQAVIHANEEKSRAVAAKEAAFDNLKDAQKNLVKCEVRSERCGEEMEALENEKNSWEKMVEEERRNAQQTISEVEQSTAQKIDACHKQKSDELSRIKAEMSASHNATLREKDAEIKEHQIVARESQRDAANSIAEIERSTALAIATANDNATALITAIRTQAAANISSANATAQELIRQTLEDASKRIALAEQERDESISQAAANISSANATAQELIRQTLEDASKRIALAEQERDESISKARAEFQNMTVTAQQEARRELDRVMQGAERRISEAQRRASEVETAAETNMNQLRKGTQRMTDAIRKEAQANMTKVLKETEEMLAEVRSTYETKETSLKEELKMLKKAAEEDLTMHRTESQRALKGAEETNKLAVMRLKQEMEQNRRHTDFKMAKLKDGHADEIADKEKNMQRLQREVQEMKARIKDLDMRLTDATTSLHYWETRHVPYCNFTLMKIDSQSFINNIAQRAFDLTNTAHTKTRHLATETLTNIQTSSRTLLDNEIKPRYTSTKRFIVNDVYNKRHHGSHYVSDASKWFYNTYAQQPVDKHLRPLYDKHIYPFYQTTVHPFWINEIYPRYQTNVQPSIDHHVPRLVDGVTHIWEATKQIVTEWIKTVREVMMRGRVVIVDGMTQASIVFLRKVEERDWDDVVPGIVLDSVRYVGEEADVVLDVILKGVVLMMVFIMRKVIRTFAFWCLRMGMLVILLPFRVVWFFCPLRLCLRTHQTPKIIQEENNMDMSIKPVQIKQDFQNTPSQ